MSCSLLNSPIEEKDVYQVRSELYLVDIRAKDRRVGFLCCSRISRKTGNHGELEDPPTNTFSRGRPRAAAPRFPAVSRVER